MRHAGLLSIFLAALLVTLVPRTALAADFDVQAVCCTSYTINGASNPTLTLVRGQTYTFNLSATGHPFYIKSTLGAGTTGEYDKGVSPMNGLETNTLTFVVPADAPSTLFYQCSNHQAMNGTIQIVSATPAMAPFAIGLLALGLCGVGLWVFRGAVGPRISLGIV
jgi:hypothetical protein